MTKPILSLALLCGLFLISCSPKKQEKKNSFAPIFEAYKQTLTDKRIADIRLIDSVSPFSVTTINGRKVEIGNGGLPTVLIFFATWCPHCERALPQLDKILDASIRRNVSVLAVGREHSESELHEWRQSTGISLEVVADPTKEIYLRFAEKIIPRLYLLDGSGNVIYQDVGWNERVKELLLQAIESLQ